jgi:hypothetical protein
VAEHGQPGWTYAADRDRLTALVGIGVPREPGWWDTDDLESCGPQWPAPPGMRTRAVSVGLDTLTLTPDGPALPRPLMRRWRDQVHATATAAKAAAKAAAQIAVDPAADAGSGADREPTTHDLAPASVDAGRRTRRYVDPGAVGTRPGLAHIDARPPHAEPASQLYVCRACDAFLPGDGLDDHLDCRWP